MPVRIYEIAKKLGVESKEVLAKAKELGITGAKVPSSSLDKITAEYLEEQFGGPKAPPESTPAATVEQPVVIVSAPAEESESGSEPENSALEPSPEPAEPEPSLSEIPAEPSPAPEPQVEPTAEQAPEAPAAAAAYTEPVTPTAEETYPETAEATVEQQAETQEAPEPAAPAPSQETPSEEPESKEQPPPEPPKPRIGEKVGFIQLPPKPAPRQAVKPPPPPQQQRPDQGRGRRDQPQRGPGFQQRPQGAPGQRRYDAAPAGRGGQDAGRRDSRQAPVAKPEPRFVSPESGELITLKPPIIVRNLAEHLKKKPFQLIADLMQLNVFANVNQAIDESTAQELCAKYGYRFEVEKRERGGGVVHAQPKKVEIEEIPDKDEELQSRAPVITIMGHVDHGKTTLLDVIRKSDVAGGESGGITQHIGAYTISIPHPERKNHSQQITFLDTPGHAAFSSMRARGANVTDIVVLVVAANDGVMPQTQEALSHAQAAKVPIIVAVNKIDHPNANPMRVRQQLQEKGLAPEEWGGETIFVDLSAVTKEGVDKLLEMILLQAEILELKANPTRPAKGNVIESGLEPGGPTATVLVRKGTLKVGQTVLCGPYYGRVRALIDEEGNRQKEAGPSVAVKVLGLNGVPDAGLEFDVVENEKVARALSEERQESDRAEDQERRPKVTLENLFDTLASETAKVFRVVVKADAQGSVEAIVEALKKLATEKVALDVIHDAVGSITESDVMLASASKAVILGFHTRIDTGVADVAKREGVQIKLYSIIYELVDQVKEAMSGLLDPLLKEVVVGSAEVRKVFDLSKGGKVAGCIVTNGRLIKGKLRVSRRKSLIYEGQTTSLRRFQDEVNEVRTGMECGVRLDGFDDYEAGDVIESYTIEKIAQKL